MRRLRQPLRGLVVVSVLSRASRPNMVLPCPPPDTPVRQPTFSDQARHDRSFRDFSQSSHRNRKGSLIFHQPWLDRVADRGTGPARNARMGHRDRAWSRHKRRRLERSAVDQGRRRIASGVSRKRASFYMGVPMHDLATGAGQSNQPRPPSPSTDRSTKSFAHATTTICTCIPHNRKGQRRWV
jgi:hypothetical protein